MLYEKYYGFIEKPFQVAPNPRYLYLSPKHQDALTYLEYGISEGDGFVLLTGDIGTGKTLLIKKLLSGIGSDLEVAVIFSTNLEAEQLINLVLNEFEIAGQFQSKAFALDALYQFLVTKFNQNKRVILIIDEAQNLPLDALEEVRMMSNIQSDTQSLIQIVLVGQPELKNILATPSLSALTQRISWHYHLGPLSRAETTEYINFRLIVAGRKTKLFTDDAMDLLHRASGGIPRTINILCENLLVYGFADEVRVIERPLVEKVLRDRRALMVPAPPRVETASSIPAVTQNQTNGLMERIIQVEKVLRDQSDLMVPVPPHEETTSSEPAMTEDEANGMMERIFELEERINNITSTSPEFTERPVDVQIPQNAVPRRHPTAPALKWTTAKARIYALNKTNSLPIPPQPSAAATPPPTEMPPERRIPEPITAADSPQAKVPPAPQVPQPITTATPLSFKVAPEPSLIRLPAAWLGWLTITVLFVIFVVWAFIPETGEEPRQSQPAQTPLVESPGLPSDQPAGPETDPNSPPRSPDIATTNDSLPVNASPATATPMPSAAAPQNESNQPPAAPVEKPLARSVSAIADKSAPASPRHDDTLSAVALKLRSQLQRDKKIVIPLSDDSNDLQLKTFTILDALAELLHRQPDAQVVILRFSGASDGYSDSQKFGESQANMVKSFLEGKGIETNRIETYGMDPTFMVVSNDSENGKQSNQRVEINIIPLPN